MSLHIEFTNPDCSTLVHIIGSPGEYLFQHREDYDPDSSQSLARLVHVGPLAIEANRAQLIQIMRAVPINNSNPELNCQTWVELAVRKLKELGIVPSDAYTRVP